MWYNSGSSEVGEIASFCQSNQQGMPNPPETPMPCMSTRSTSLPEREQSIYETISASSVTRGDTTHPSIRDIPEEEESPHNKEHTPHGELPKLGKLKEIRRSTTS